MKNLGRSDIYLTGSRKYIQRSVYEKNGKFFVKWYGQLIEVVRKGWAYSSVETY